MVFLRLIRVRHYIKNILVFVPLVFSGSLLNQELLLRTFAAFVSFCLVSSIVYVFNDICDRERDKEHPTKKDRPIASGQISLKAAASVIAVLASGLFAILFILGNRRAVLCIVVYLGVNIIYSLRLKNYPIIDISVLALGFFLRIYFGAVITDIPISKWLFLTVIAMSFYMALGKRRNELMLQTRANKEFRPSLAGYSYAFLENNLYMCLTLANAFYALWASEHDKKAMIWTVPLVIVAGLRYTLIVESNQEGDPTEIILRDRFLNVLGFCYIIVVLILLYH